MSLPPCVWCIVVISPTVIHHRPDVPSRYSMDSPSFTLLRFLCTKTFIPGGARGVLLKSNVPSIVVCSNIVGFFQQVINIYLR